MKFTMQVAFLTLLVTLGARGDYQELDGIVAIVEDDVVLASELHSRLDAIRTQLKANKVTAPPNDILVSQVMERLIVESLQLQEADRRGVQIDDETLTRAVNSFAKNNGVTLDQLTQRLAQEGTSYREFRDQIRQEMIISRIQRNIVNRRIRISEQEIDAMLQSPYYKQLFQDEYRVGHILLQVESNANEATITLALTRAKEIVEQLRKGAEFCEMSAANSSSSRALECGDLGWRKGAEIPSLFGEAILSAQQGDTLDPIRSGSSIHIVQLLEQRGAGMQQEAQTDVRHILIKTSEIRSSEEAKAIIEELHVKVMAGADFAETAIANSDDPGTALNGGSLGWSSGKQFVEAFSAMMAETDVGEVSRPFQSTFGWHFLKIEGRRMEDQSEEALKDMAVRVLANRRFEEELPAWLKELRDEAFVEIRI